MKVVVVAGGPQVAMPVIPPADHYVGVDHGTMVLLDQGLPVSLAVGDFDSLSPAEWVHVSQQVPAIKQSIPEKDDTDVQLALLEVWQRWQQAEVTLLGATGGRLDHFLANLWLPLEPRFQPYLSQLELRDRQNVIRFYLPGNYTVAKVADMHYLAYCCLTPVTHLTLTGSKYTLTDVAVKVPTSYASNEFLTDTADFSFASGLIAVIQSRDA